MRTHECVEIIFIHAEVGVRRWWPQQARCQAR
jgi:hypothetical protein